MPFMPGSESALFCVQPRFRPWLCVVGYKREPPPTCREHCLTPGNRLFTTVGNGHHVDNTTSCSLYEAKRCRARLALRWGTTWDALVLFLFFCTCIEYSINQTVKLYIVHTMYVHFVCVTPFTFHFDAAPAQDFRQSTLGPGYLPHTSVPISA